MGKRFCGGFRSRPTGARRAGNHLANGSDPMRPVFASWNFRWISERAFSVRERSVVLLFSGRQDRIGVQLMAKKRKQLATKRIGKRKSVSKKAQPSRKAAVALKRRQDARKTSRKKAVSRVVVLRDFGG